MIDDLRGNVFALGLCRLGSPPFLLLLLEDPGLVVDGAGLGVVPNRREIWSGGGRLVYYLLGVADVIVQPASTAAFIVTDTALRSVDARAPAVVVRGATSRRAHVLWISIVHI